MLFTYVRIRKEGWKSSSPNAVHVTRSNRILWEEQVIETVPGYQMNMYTVRVGAPAYPIIQPVVIRNKPYPGKKERLKWQKNCMSAT